MRHALKLSLVLAFCVAAPLRAGSLEDGEAAYAREDYATALKLLKPLADQGDPKAELKLGVMYRFGFGTTADPAAGDTWVEKSATQGYQPARDLMVVQCMGAADGRLPAYCSQAMGWLRERADKGEPQAQLMLGMLYVLGRAGLPHDPEQGLAWTRKAAHQGDVRAEMELGQMYTSSMLGVQADQAQSLMWYRKAADQGDPGAESLLGQFYELGMNGLVADPAQALAWYGKAAAQGEAMAMSSLAEMYAQGHGVPVDEAQAVGWYRKLAETGNSDAAAKVGTAYALGRGVPRDDEQAYVWLSVAIAEAPSFRANDLDSTVLARDSIAARLSPGQLARAKAEIEAWKKKLDR